MELISDIFTDLGDLIATKRLAVTDNATRLTRKEIVRNFVNLMPTMSEKEGEDKNRTELTNFGRSFRQAQGFLNPLETLVTGTDSLTEVIVDRNDPRTDALLGVEISNAFNEGVVNRSGKFGDLWRGIVSEGYVSGGATVVFEYDDEGLYPQISTNLIFPKKTALDPNKITYAFEPLSLTVDDLRVILERTSEADSNVNRSGIKELLEGLQENIRRHSEITTSTDTPLVDFHNQGDSVRDGGGHDGTDSTHLDACRYWEVRQGEDGKHFVSSIIFVEGPSTRSQNKGNDSEKFRQILIQEEKALDDPTKWLTFFVFDEEIGGQKTTDTLRGIAEAHYPASLEIEELTNLELEGAKIRARPKFAVDDTVNPDDVLDMDLINDSWVPKNLEEFEFKTSNSELRPIIADLLQTSAGISSSSNSNTGRDQELRTQSVDRQAQNAAIVGTRIRKAYKKLDHLLDLMLERALTLDVSPSEEDYLEIKWFQETVDRAIAVTLEFEDLKEAARVRKELGKKTFGRFESLRVRARKNASGLDRGTELENSKFMVELLNTGRIPPVLVPELLQIAITLQTQNPDYARLFAQDLQPLVTDQRRIAASEWPTVMLRATSGRVHPVSPDDSHPEHAEEHMVDLASMVNAHQLEPWTQLTVAEFAAGSDHTGEHFAQMRGRKEFQGVAQRLLPQLQDIVAQASQIIEQISQEQEDGEGADLDRLEQLTKIQLNQAKIEKLGTDIGLAIQEAGGLNQQRQSREKDSDNRFALGLRQQFANELNSDREFRLKQQQIKDNAANTKTQNGSG